MSSTPRPPGRPSKPGSTSTATPEQLRHLDQWVLYRLIQRDGKDKPDKVPFASAGSEASTTDPTTWSSYGAAEEALVRGEGDGLGFVFARGGGLTGVDLDHCRNPETGEIAPWARAILDQLSSYSEVSPSGTGVHVVVVASKSTTKCKRLIKNAAPDAAVEVYDGARYFTVTGKRLTEYPATVEARQAELDALCLELWPPRQAPPPRHAGREGHQPDDEQVLRVMFAGPGGAERESLWNGDTSQHGGDDSAADQALVNHLWRYCADEAQVERLWLASPLGQRGKTQKREDYRRRTIESAANAVTERFDWSATSTTGRTVGPIKGGETTKTQDLPREEAPLSDLANATRMIRIHGRDLLYSGALGWLKWDGTRYRPCSNGEELLAAQDTVRVIYGEARAALRTAKTEEEIARAKARLKAAKALHESKHIFPLVRHAAPQVAVDTSALDSHPYFFNCLNGTLDLHTGKLLAHDRAHRLTKIAGCAYDPEATSPTWDAFLERVQPSEEVRRCLQRIVGSAMIGEVREHHLIIFHGDGSNGKGTFKDAILALFGDFGWEMQVEEILASRNGSDRHTTGRADLFGRRFVVTSESGDGAALNEPLVKLLTGGDKITARRMRKDNFSFPPSHTMVIATNSRPRVRGQEHAIWRRLRLFPWNVTIHEEETDPDLPRKLLAELPGILRWAVEGCLIYQQIGIAPPAEVTRATADYRRNEDALLEWLELSCELGVEHEATSKELHASYQTWARDAGLSEPMGARGFGLALEQRGYHKHPTRKKGNSPIRLGLRLLTPMEMKAREAWTPEPPPAEQPEPQVKVRFFE
ncbi:MAG: phage/plasmid primase, P4 family [Polyangia bacterium]|jgi:putative DNA primase/helicase|nr:phage/plasmid primase, P4 family [Polyangia bacterium]